MSNYLSFLNKHSRLSLWLAILVYIVINLVFVFKKYNGFDYNLFDLAIFNQVFFNTLHGDWFNMTINLHNYLGDHFTPIIFLLLPFYSLSPGPENLLILQTIILALSAWPIYLIAKRVLADKIWALVPAVLWLLNPFVQDANFFEFHLLPFAAFLILWTFYFYQKKQFKWFILFFVLSLLVREDISLILVAFSALAWFDKRSWSWKITSFILPVAYFLLAMQITSSFSVSGNYEFFIYYSWLGYKTPLGIVWGAISQPLKTLGHIFMFKNVFNTFILFLPLLFLPLFKPRYLVLGALPFLEFILAASGLSTERHYIILLLPAIFIALIFVLQDIKQQTEFPSSKFIYKHFAFLSILLAFTALYFAFFLSPVKYVAGQKYNSEIINLRKEFLAEIGPDSSLVTNLGLLNQVSTRSIVYPLYYSYFGWSQFGYSEFILPQVDYLLVDNNRILEIVAEKRSGSFWIDTTKDLSANWRARLKDYKLFRAKNQMSLWVEAQKIDQGWPVYELRGKPEDLAEAFLVDATLSEWQGLQQLKLSYQKTPELTGERIIRFYKADYYFDMPVDYAIYQPSYWPEDQLLSFYYYLSSDVEAYQIFEWQGRNIMGDYGQAIIEYEVLEPISDKLILSDI